MLTAEMPTFSDNLAGQKHRMTRQKRAVNTEKSQYVVEYFVIVDYANYIRCALFAPFTSLYVLTLDFSSLLRNVLCLHVGFVFLCFIVFVFVLLYKYSKYDTINQIECYDAVVDCLAD